MGVGLLTPLVAVLIAARPEPAFAARRATLAHPPAIVSIWASPRETPGVGAPVVIRIRVRHATTCRFSIARAEMTVPCASGLARVTVPPIENKGPLDRVLTYRVVASSRLGLARSSVMVVQFTKSAPATGRPSSVARPIVSGAKDRSPRVVGLGVCTPGPDCDYGPINALFPDYGNAGLSALRDCTFAAVANWEQIVHGTAADPAVIKNEFAEAGGTADGGLPLDTLWNYWKQSAINGLVLTGLQPYGTGRADIENVVRSEAAVLALLHFGSGDTIGQYRVSEDAHLLVVDGFTPTGPLVVSWAQTLQMTWQQWDREAVGVWLPNAVLNPVYLG